MFKKKLLHDENRLEIVSDNSPFAYVESYKTFRTNLSFVSLQNQYKKLVLTSAIPGEGKSSVAINMAKVLAEGGFRVLLMDCDLRKPMLHRYLRAQRYKAKGLSTVLSGLSPLEESVTSFSDLKIDLMTAGPIPPNPAELLASVKMANLLDALESTYGYDYIICDTPPVGVVTDAASLSQYCDGVVFVVKQKFATYEQVQVARQNLDAVHANIIGSVLNQYDIGKNTRKAKKNYSYYNYSDYSRQESNANL